MIAAARHPRTQAMILRTAFRAHCFHNLTPSARNPKTTGARASHRPGAKLPCEPAGSVLFVPFHDFGDTSDRQ